MKMLLFKFLFIASYALSAQKYDYTWLLGFGSRISPSDTLGITVMNFNSPSLNPKIYFEPKFKIDFEGSNSCISNYRGEFQFATNSSRVMNKLGTNMWRGIDIDPGPSNYSVLFPQSCLILPSHSDSSRYFVLHESNDFTVTSSKPFFYRNVYMDKMQGNGDLHFKSYTLSSDSMQITISAVKHANGRDWWINKILYDGNRIATFLQTKDTISLINIQNIERKIQYGFSQTCYSPNGNYFASFSSYNDSIGSILDLLKFDRCSGKFQYLNKFYFKNTGAATGVSFSPNSRFMYIGALDTLYQVELISDSMKLDIVAVLDDFYEDLGGGFIGRVFFGQMQLGPDGRIYVVSNLYYRSVGIISKPNKFSSNCLVGQHSLKLPTLQNCVPVSPNYRLGPIDDSPCDTLGIDNIPVAEYRYDQDTSYYRKMEFTNLSWYEPDEWWWDWGDGSPMYYTTVWDTSIIHEYAKDGIYNVCLRAKNKNGENSICKELRIGITDVKNPVSAGIDINIQPNPAYELFVINVENYLPERMQLRMYNLQGELVKEQRLFPGSNVIDVEGLSNGMYVVEVLERNEIVHTEKVVKM